MINHIKTVADPAQLTDLSESELTGIVQRMHISEVFETEEYDEVLEKTDITDILSQEAQGDLTVDIQGSILIKTTLIILVQKYHDIFSTTVKEKSARALQLDFKVDAAWETTGWETTEQVVIRTES